MSDRVSHALVPGIYARNGVAYRAGKRLWTAEDDAHLRQLYPDQPTDDVATELGRSLAATYGRARLLGVEKSAAYLASPAACRLRRGDQVGTATRFQPGQVPANKGLRRPGWGPGRMKATQFQPGVLNGVARQRFQPIGATRWVGGYLYVKVSAEPGPWTRNWKLVHVRAWEAAHGPLPAGHALLFRNGDKSDTRVENLELVTRQELMRRNSVHGLPPTLKKTIQLLGAVKRQIRRRESHAHDR
jgi:hypothetical protein